MGKGVQHKYDSPSPNEDHDVDLDVDDINNLPQTLAAAESDAESLHFFLQL